MAAAVPGHGKKWLPALLLSLLLHAGIGVALTLIPHVGDAVGDSGCVKVDGCALDPAEDQPATTTQMREVNPEPFTAVLVAPPAVAELTAPATAAPPGPPMVAATKAGSPDPRSDEPARNSPRTSATSFFHVEAQGRTFVYVIDRSSSMGLHGALATAGQQLLASLEQLPATARFQVIVYNRTAEPLVASQPSYMTANPENVQRVARHLAGLVAEGGTDHLPALRRALALRPDVLFFLTDADDLTAEHLRAAADLNAGRHTVIHTIELNTRNRERTDLPMHLLARDHGGTYQAVDLPPSY